MHAHTDRSDDAPPPRGLVDRHASVDRILSYDLDFLVARVVRKRLMPRGIAEEALREYRRFMVISLFSAEVPMCSAEVDEIWHAHLLHTRDYQEFCRDCFGAFVHHQPEPARDAASAGPEPEADAAQARAAFFREYRVLFGEPSYLWGPRPDPAS